MPMTWTDQADARLLVGIINLHNVKLDHKALAQFMGPECTPSAIQHRIQRLKEKVQSTTSADDAAPASSQQAEGNDTPLSSPTKAKRGRPAKRGGKTDAGPASKRAKAKTISDDSA
ncbi:hypothetical protein BBP40_005227 [Aspergillus hancockii]|nr:hypothetical protein BBP40_005227 [Aspergillus hancockii]